MHVPHPRNREIHALDMTAERYEEQQDDTDGDQAAGLVDTLSIRYRLALVRCD
jgi:hypothetical protein